MPNGDQREDTFDFPAKVEGFLLGLIEFIRRLFTTFTRIAIRPSYVADSIANTENRGGLVRIGVSGAFSGPRRRAYVKSAGVVS